MKRITLTRGLFALIDDADYLEVSKYHWYAGHRLAGVCDARTQIGNKKISMSRFIMKPKNDELVDHKNKNPLDNRRINLRLVDVSKSIKNRDYPSISKTKGVYKTKAGNWLVGIWISGKQHYLGTYRSLEKAKEVYCKKYIDVFLEDPYIVRKKIKLPGKSKVGFNSHRSNKNKADKYIYFNKKKNKWIVSKIF